MQKRVFIIHGHNGYPEEGWLPWLRRELVERGYIVSVPPMPDPAWPSRVLWTSYLADVVGHCDEYTYFVGHSLGCQAILRYLQNLPLTARVGGAVFVAGFERLSRNAVAVQQLQDWLNEPIHWEAIRGKSRHFVALFSDNDDWVSLENVRIFDEKLNAKTMVLHNRLHFSNEDGVDTLPEALEEILCM